MEFGKGEIIMAGPEFEKLFEQLKDEYGTVKGAYAADKNNKSILKDFCVHALNAMQGMNALDKRTISNFIGKACVELGADFTDSLYDAFKGDKVSEEDKKLIFSGQVNASMAPYEQYSWNFLEGTATEQHKNDFVNAVVSVLKGAEYYAGKGDSDVIKNDEFQFTLTNMLAEMSVPLKDAGYSLTKLQSDYPKTFNTFGAVIKEKNEKYLSKNQTEAYDNYKSGKLPADVFTKNLITAVSLNSPDKINADLYDIFVQTVMENGDDFLTSYCAEPAGSENAPTLEDKKSLVDYQLRNALNASKSIVNNFSAGGIGSDALDRFARPFNAAVKNAEQLFGQENTAGISDKERDDAIEMIARTYAATYRALEGKGTTFLSLQKLGPNIMDSVSGYYNTHKELKGYDKLIQAIADHSNADQVTKTKSVFVIGFDAQMEAAANDPAKKDELNRNIDELNRYIAETDIKKDKGFLTREDEDAYRFFMQQVISPQNKSAFDKLKIQSPDKQPYVECYNKCSEIFVTKFDSALKKEKVDDLAEAFLDQANLWKAFGQQSNNRNKLVEMYFTGVNQYGSRFTQKVDSVLFAENEPYKNLSHAISSAAIKAIKYLPNEIKDRVDEEKEKPEKERDNDLITALNAQYDKFTSENYILKSGAERIDERRARGAAEAEIEVFTDNFVHALQISDKETLSENKWKIVESMNGIPGNVRRGFWNKLSEKLAEPTSKAAENFSAAFNEALVGDYNDYSLVGKYKAETKSLAAEKKTEEVDHFANTFKKALDFYAKTPGYDEKLKQLSYHYVIAERAMGKALTKELAGKMKTHPEFKAQVDQLKQKTKGLPALSAEGYRQFINGSEATDPETSADEYLGLRNRFNELRGGAFTFNSDEYTNFAAAYDKFANALSEDAPDIELKRYTRIALHEAAAAYYNAKLPEEHNDLQQKRMEFAKRVFNMTAPKQPEKAPENELRAEKQAENAPEAAGLPENTVNAMKEDIAQKFRSELDGYEKSLRDASAVFSSSNSAEYNKMLTTITELKAYMNDPAKAQNGAVFDFKDPAFGEKLKNVKDAAADYFAAKLAQDKNATRLKRFETAEKLMGMTSPEELLQQRIDAELKAQNQHEDPGRNSVRNDAAKEKPDISKEMIKKVIKQLGETNLRYYEDAEKMLTDPVFEKVMKLAEPAALPNDAVQVNDVRALKKVVDCLYKEKESRELLQKKDLPAEKKTQALRDIAVGQAIRESFSKKFSVGGTFTSDDEARANNIQRLKRYANEEKLQEYRNRYAEKTDAQLDKDIKQHTWRMFDQRSLKFVYSYFESQSTFTSAKDAEMFVKDADVAEILNDPDFDKKEFPRDFEYAKAVKGAKLVYDIFEKEQKGWEVIKDKSSHSKAEVLNAQRDLVLGQGLRNLITHNKTWLDEENIKPMKFFEQFADNKSAVEKMKTELLQKDKVQESEKSIKEELKAEFRAGSTLEDVMPEPLK